MRRTEIKIDADEGGEELQAQFLRSLRDAQGALYGCILALVPAGSDADEVFQETVWVLWKEYQAEGPPINFSAWSNSVARNIARGYIRRERRRGRVQLSEAHLNMIAKVHAGSSELLELRQEMLRHCLGHMSDGDRALLMSCYGPEASIHVVARKQGQTTASLYSRLKRLRHRLFECVNRRMSGRNP
ncbi:MAG TPA: sigma-70 family RNA polymerase sigma factor [Caulifigura sp.]|jgi:RNA polymerase sigma-70 factor (ECF subfamily)|nr:sigma-70 family RNA polymerase sigma factor [Caulifigura sp.]